MLQWYRWQDWLNLILGVWLFLSPGLFQVPLGGSAAWIGWFMGIIIIAMAIWALAVPDDREVEFTRAVLGALLFITPWVFGFTAQGFAWNVWAVGLAVVALSYWANSSQEQGRDASETFRQF